VIEFTVPFVPPSVNHYAKHTRKGRHYQTGEAVAFKAAVAIHARGETVEGKRFRVTLLVRLAEGQRGDVDNFPKLCLDGLANAGVFRDKKGKRMSDAHVRDLRVVVDDWTRPKEGCTCFEVEAMK
jgi:crossover junction endodeoxyribonuclease RusA